ncbi:hypothetical protein HHI36_015812 [Cryptolaemus montrouzieri]|uniref:Uncharacterized protein n=1 Tax=Cryptolaemus montrouzieri TaxID=559131 RepID=A0ABD2N7F0_9CUCU
MAISMDFFSEHFLMERSQKQNSKNITEIRITSTRLVTQILHLLTEFSAVFFFLFRIIYLSVFKRFIRDKIMFKSFENFNIILFPDFSFPFPLNFEISLSTLRNLITIQELDKKVDNN